MQVEGYLISDLPLVYQKGDEFANHRNESGDPPRIYRKVYTIVANQAVSGTTLQ